MAIPVITADKSRWGGVVEVRRRILNSAFLQHVIMQIVGGNPNRVGWRAIYTTPGIGAVALPLAMTPDDPGYSVSPGHPASWVLRANGDYLELDVAVDSVLATEPVWGWWQPTYVEAATGSQHVEVWEYIRIHDGADGQ